jgi:hypothetical protein
VGSTSIRYLNQLLLGPSHSGVSCGGPCTYSLARWQGTYCLLCCAATRLFLHYFCTWVTEQAAGPAAPCGRGWSAWRDACCEACRGACWPGPLRICLVGAYKHHSTGKYASQSLAFTWHHMAAQRALVPRTHPVTASCHRCFVGTYAMHTDCIATLLAMSFQSIIVWCLSTNGHETVAIVICKAFATPLTCHGLPAWVDSGGVRRPYSISHLPVRFRAAAHDSSGQHPPRCDGSKERTL